MRLPQSLADLGLKAMSQAHRAIVHLSGGRVLGSTFGIPAVELHTVGRRSGLPRSTMLSARRAVMASSVMWTMMPAACRLANKPRSQAW
jgi:hypothetical protein